MTSNSVNMETQFFHPLQSQARFACHKQAIKNITSLLYITLNIEQKWGMEKGNIKDSGQHSKHYASLTKQKDYLSRSLKPALLYHFHLHHYQAERTEPLRSKQLIMWKVKPNLHFSDTPQVGKCKIQLLRKTVQLTWIAAIQLSHATDFLVLFVLSAQQGLMDFSGVRIWR